MVQQHLVCQMHSLMGNPAQVASNLLWRGEACDISILDRFAWALHKVDRKSRTWRTAWEWT